MKGYIAYELIFAVLAVVAIGLGYAALTREEVPSPSSVAGYTLGITGFVLMLSTETLYTLRKRWPNFNFGPTRIWLKLHVFTGIVGPFLVLLHSSWRFNGLAGILTLVVGVVVLSGLIGRFLYTAVPRYVEGADETLGQLREKLAGARRRLQQLGLECIACSLADEISRRSWKNRFNWLFGRRYSGRELKAMIEKLPPEDQARITEYEELLAEQERVFREMRSLEAGRRLFALWYFFHIPLSVGMFLLAFVHIIAALYYTAFTG